MLKIGTFYENSRNFQNSKIFGRLLIFITTSDEHHILTLFGDNQNLIFIERFILNSFEFHLNFYENWIGRRSS